jgi:formate dehydrogenase gamma subunit
MTRPRIIKSDDGTVLVERFPPARRLEHGMAIATFVLLLVTGFPQKFYQADWARFVIDVLGGLDATRTLHRVVGVVFAIHLLLHVSIFVAGLLTRRMRPSLVPGFQDLRDAWADLGYYLGFRERPAALPKFDYRQKFEYVGLILGGFVMAATGLLLYFPRFFVTFVPGELVPAARVAHSNEALLALLVLAIWHIYAAVLSPEVFPLDKSVFTGFIPAEELKHRHRREWERLFPEEAARERAEREARQAAEAAKVAAKTTEGIAAERSVRPVLSEKGA